ncbi:right-handed parallel beta-helix repeat-containing protein [Mitsuaria sp. WAJ17]|uniref:chondroitinase-B domain-containing protein n=1 Tax=Mitsuaria sp. WAJ17 TaxID=2761452 RepID=UPI001601EDEE|nr:chondroitinase-B domain-containing protein [Mitsuaria sp. WAJ17]MBB2485624.1 right-handed parallel beta-helix repeat-containing protein [Mitsuaria sp. WAJ17]
MKVRRLPLIAAALLLLVLIVSFKLVYADLDRLGGTPWTSKRGNDYARYLLKRLEGHPKLETVFQPLLQGWQSWLEPEVDLSQHPDHGRGARAESARSVRQQALAGHGKIDEDLGRRLRLVDSPAALEQALQEARPGDILELADGRYPITRSLWTRTAGTAEQPITLRAAHPRAAVLVSETATLFEITEPHWHFEDLDIEGHCKPPGCEHALHVTGKASHFRAENNVISDFDSHVKVNGSKGLFPDHGRLSRNTLLNKGERVSARPANPVDIVAASHWVIGENIVRHFVHPDDKTSSYGIFMKGGGSSGRIERNLVICAAQGVSSRGTRLGISFGGGLTGPSFCRDQLCRTEHENGLARANIVANCNDAGLDINHSTSITLEGNVLINTAGINVRGTSPAARLIGNLGDGSVRTFANKDVSSDGLGRAPLDAQLKILP